MGHVKTYEQWVNEEIKYLNDYKPKGDLIELYFSTYSDKIGEPYFERKYKKFEKEVEKELNSFDVVIEPDHGFNDKSLKILINRKDRTKVKNILNRLSTKYKYESELTIEKINESISFSDLYRPKNHWIRLYKDGQYDDLLTNLYVLSDTAYGPLGGHPDFKDESKLWKMEWRPMIKDIDATQQTVIIGHNTANGFKVLGVGHDGLKSGRRELMRKLAQLLTVAGYWMETGSHVAEKLYDMKVPYLDELGYVLDIYDDIEWVGDRGWYYRKHGGEMMKLTTFGRPVSE